MPIKPKDLGDRLEEIRKETQSMQGTIYKEVLTWSDGNLSTIQYYDQNNNLLLTVTFTWDSDGNLVQMEKS
ncbi:MAG: hypothetical protein ACE5J9_05520 [Methanosarcinales archaeon]